jgi:gluconolactonase
MQSTTRPDSFSRPPCPSRAAASRRSTSRAALAGLALGASSCAPPAAAPEASSPAAAETTVSVPRAAARELPAFCADAAAAPAPPPRAQAELVANGFVFVEGPVWSEASGAFFFSEMDFNAPGDNGPLAKIHRLVLPSAIEVFIADSGSNGLAVDDEGLVACTHDTQTVSRYDLTTKARSVLVGDYQSKHFNSPNDVALHSKGHVYFSDPDWQLGARENQTGVTGVYWRAPDGTVTLVDGELPKPNGVTLSPDETWLYVGASNGKIARYPVLEDGSLGAREAFADVPEPDGMGVDCAGRLYATSHGPGEVVVLSPEGDVVSRIGVAPRATNVAFGGPDRKTLLITAGSGVYRLDGGIAGFPY